MIYYEKHRSNQSKYLYFQEDSDLNFVKHLHTTYEFIFVTEGELLCEVDSITYTLTKGKAIIIFPNQTHSYSTSNHSVSSLIVFSSDYIKSFHDVVKGCLFTNPVLDYSDTLSYLELKNNTASQFRCKSILYDICDKCIKNSPLKKRDNPQDELSSRIISLIQDHYMEDISLKQIAKQLNYNYTYLSNYFNQTMQCTFSAFLNAFRLEYALYLLDHTSDSITNIAVSCGFSTIRSFNIAFKASYHISPKQYRLRNNAT